MACKQFDVKLVDGRVKEGVTVEKGGSAEAIALAEWLYSSKVIAWREHTPPIVIGIPRTEEFINEPHC